MITPVIFQLWCVQEALHALQREHGPAFLLRFLECLEKPWLVRR